MHQLWAALCLVFVIEGMILLAAPRGWQEMVKQAAQMDPNKLRVYGVVAVLFGLIALHFVQS